MKKIVAIALSLVMLMSMMTFPAYADAPDNGIPENAVRHTIQLKVEPSQAPANNGASTYMWSSGDYDLNSGSVLYTLLFYPEHRYLAFETSATDINGNGFNENYITQFVVNFSGLIASATNVANGSVKKVDWIDVSTDSQYQFKIANTTSRAILVTITYYTWS